MRRVFENRYLINKSVELVKYSLALIFLAWILVKAPDQVAQIVSLAGAFILGGSKVAPKLLG